MSFKTPVKIVIASIFILFYSAFTTLFTTVGMDFFKGGPFKNTYGLLITRILLPLDILYIVSGLGILFLKAWGRKLLMKVSPVVSFLYILLVGQYLITGNGLNLNIQSIILTAVPIAFLYFFNKEDVKKFF